MDRNDSFLEEFTYYLKSTKKVHLRIAILPSHETEQRDDKPPWAGFSRSI